jgi:hypothetical protein
MAFGQVRWAGHTMEDGRGIPEFDLIAVVESMADRNPITVHIRAVGRAEILGPDAIGIVSDANMAPADCGVGHSDIRQDVSTDDLINPERDLHQKRKSSSRASRYIKAGYLHRRRHRRFLGHGSLGDDRYRRADFAKPSRRRPRQLSGATAAGSPAVGRAG